MNVDILDTFTKGTRYIDMVKAGLILILDVISDILGIRKSKLE